MRIFLQILVFILACAPLSQAQPIGQNDIQLAQYYYTNGDFEKATLYYEKLYSKDPSKQIFLRYTDCLFQTKQFKLIEKLYKRQINSNRQDFDYQVSLGKFYEDIGEGDKASGLYENLIKNLPPSPTKIIELYRLFLSRKKNDLAFECLKKGKKITSYGYELEFSEIHLIRGEKKEMLNLILSFLSQNPDRIDNVQQLLSSKLNLEDQSSSDYLLTKDILISSVQKTNSPLIISELVTWLFIQSKNFSAAYNQTVALEKRLNGDGNRIYDLAAICMENKAYEAARKCYSYLMNQPNPAYIIEAQRGLLNARYLEITTNRNYTEQEITATILEYEQALQRFGKQVKTHPIVIELSHILAYYAAKAPEAIQLLKEALTIAGSTDMQKAQVKMQLADIYVLSDDIWEASLLYMQVDKDFKFEAIGNEAKYKNARIFYYDGEFNYAQAQLDVLKESTSKLIANDAIQLSVSITDNFGLDSNFQAMFWFAKSELLVEQHKYTEAFQLMDSIRINFPYHSLADEMMMRKGKAMEMQGKWTDAVAYYEDILKFHPRDILADDALFRIGDIKENILLDKEQAQETYKRLLMEYKSSLFSAEARKRFRALRGDQFSEGDI
ncbi:MAG: tetratricopeptide repeat protein [Bacteroidetes bacterium]|nr:tetratricopeptide repeat protein [Bacteroidota bacterium]